MMNAEEQARESLLPQDDEGMSSGTARAILDESVHFRILAGIIIRSLNSVTQRELLLMGKVGWQSWRMIRSGVEL